VADTTACSPDFHVRFHAAAHAFPATFLHRQGGEGEQEMHDVLSLGAAWSASMPWSPLRILRRWYLERQTAMALMSLEDALLKDIGIYRGEIPGIVRERHRLR
jgi:uncharacterized protein YjiS (DUF1127 family)